MIGRLLRDVVCAVFDLHTTGDLRDAQAAAGLAVERAMAKQREEIEQLRAELARLRPAHGPAMGEAACPRCHAPAGEGCRDAAGRLLRRMHAERGVAWRAAVAARDAELAGPTPDEVLNGQPGDDVDLNSLPF
ncbi:MAG: hypothetical protein FJ125_07415 [Deltaproteobacteria bacterium]|nr:hypothetical protein [Deltaproteobacteria bacterium]